MLTQLATIKTAEKDNRLALPVRDYGFVCKLYTIRGDMGISCGPPFH